MQNRTNQGHKIRFSCLKQFSGMNNLRGSVKSSVVHFYSVFPEYPPCVVALSTCFWLIWIVLTSLCWGGGKFCNQSVSKWSLWGIKVMETFFNIFWVYLTMLSRWWMLGGHPPTWIHPLGYTMLQELNGKQIKWKCLVLLKNWYRVSGEVKDNQLTW